MKKQNEIAIGIDLGVSYSRVGVMIKDQFQVVSNEFGNKQTPSYVAFTDQERLIGEAAQNQQAKNPTNTIFNVMKLIGRKFSDKIVQQEIQKLPFKIEADKYDRPVIVVNFRQKILKLHAEEVCSMILSKMKNIAENHLGIKISQAVLITSCNLNFFSKRAIEDAGLISGLKILRIMIGSTSSYFTYGMKLLNGNRRIALIMNIGGGSITVSVGEIENQVIEIKSISGDDNFGGEDFDHILVNYCCEIFQEKYGIDLKQDARAMRRLKMQCQKTKETLSTVNQTTIEIEYITKELDFILQINRKIFENLCQSLFHKCLYHIESVLKEASLTKFSIDQVILTGGSSRIPKIQDLLMEYFNGKQLYHSIDKDEAAIYGATFMAALLKGQSQICKKWLLLDIIPYNLGIGINDYCESFIINKNTNLPCKLSQRLKFNQENLKTLTIFLYQGEQLKQKENCRKLGYIQIHRNNNHDLQSEIIIYPGIDENNQFVISAEDAISQQKLDVSVQYEQQILLDEEIQRLIEESETLQNNDVKVKMKIEAKNKFETIIYHYKRILMDEFDRQEKWLESHQDEDSNIYNKKIEEIQQKFEPFAQSMNKEYTKQQYD
ncbi:unnamed protein product [Paramecium sonneborni]|uniref:Heat shock protein 70 n=1 Tax=Paramecium sonneborni TaxID=65129 RepID=A0A8S1QT05_9CILI|nr:unnamed protein product [Paramecium sonneborni]